MWMANATFTGNGTGSNMYGYMHARVVAERTDSTTSSSIVVKCYAVSDGGTYETSIRLSSVPLGVTEIPLRGVGRVFRLRFSSVNGAPFTLDAPVTLLFDQQKRPG